MFLNSLATREHGLEHFVICIHQHIDVIHEGVEPLSVLVKEFVGHFAGHPGHDTDDTFPFEIIVVVVCRVKFTILKVLFRQQTETIHR